MTRYQIELVYPGTEIEKFRDYDCKACVFNKIEDALDYIKSAIKEDLWDYFYIRVNDDQVYRIPLK